ncbi:relaxase/mobilization nuclease domain-containing protein (plasmid) [Bradyrhizobium sp. CCGUVB1N3]|uniref:relaxase/mobilization nuclease domain-containing protein n=1 Tax=Bradyrhizobium sp. CCGUVB1N3 TaxID=2949629 RepID=UPI0020B1D086|nr:relaxase/mobilization nuclease domain-containing protein [Bradyrhizobium sp. CCGUVB1N3]MCP3477842.1 relaxase/mobilization nuclease domain-containing protein [Bradyrhizobium sp. CCGUVB1N3]
MTRATFTSQYILPPPPPPTGAPPAHHRLYHFRLAYCGFERAGSVHFISFTPGTNQEAAYAAGRGWAAKMFGSGFGGGQYNYLTAFYTDRGHPHLHVVVNRRELLGRARLKISRRHPHLNYKALRTEMAEISRQHGIMLDASSRAERGAHRAADDLCRIPPV